MLVLPTGRRPPKTSLRDFSPIYSVHRCAAVLAASLFAITSCVLASGFDLTDESHYLLAIWRPWVYEATISQFGFIYFPLSALFGHDLWLLRLSNLIISWLLVAGLFLSLIPAHSHQATTRTRICLAFSLASSTLFQLNFGLSTPSYNTLNFQGLICLAIAIVWLPQKYRIAATLAGIAGALILLAKPSSALCAALIYVGVLPMITKPRLWISALTISALSSTCALAGFGMLLEGDPMALVRRILGGWKALNILLPDRTLIGSVRLDAPPQWPLILSAVILYTILLAHRTPYSSNTTRLYSQLWFYSAFAVTFITTIFASKYLKAPQLIVLSLLPVAAIATTRRKFGRRDLTIASALCLLPLAYAFGSGNNYWLVAVQCGALWVASALILANPDQPANTQRFWNRSTVLVSCLAGLTVLNLAAKPYRQETLLFKWENTETLAIMGGEVLVHKKTKTFATKLRGAAIDAGWKAHTPLIDLSGETPGAALLLNATAPVSPWIIGGLPRSRRFAQWIIDTSDNSSHTPWYLTSPNGQRRIELETHPPAGSYTRVLSASLPCPKKSCDQVELWAPIDRTTN